ncbi:cytochrome c [Mesorhizobium tianshanense]|nr:c-type cytochrome [Mesorhizobium tianshanense]
MKSEFSRSVGWSVAVMSAMVAAVYFLVSTPVASQEEDATEGDRHAHEMTDVWDIARGGELYDNWMAVMEVDAPEGTHPAYPAAGKQEGPGTWRCKECHGWDYMGVEGGYSKGSHYTGIKGVRGVAGMEPEKIHDIIMNKTHAFTKEMMPHSAMEKLALFLSRGQIDVDQYIDRKTKAARGNAGRGAGFYQNICAVCHGFDGKTMNFGDDAAPEFVGTVAADNPWEALHKIRFGQPGVGMVALGVLPIQDLVDILAYAQTLPTE